MTGHDHTGDEGHARVSLGFAVLVGVCGVVRDGSGVGA